jgi:hypothetical protein
LTTDVAPEVQTPIAEAPEAEAPLQTPIDPGDAATANADAGATPEPAADNSAQVDAIVQELLQKESATEKPETTQAPEPQVDPEVLRHAEEARNRYQGNHKTRHDAIDTEGAATVNRLVADGYSQVVAEALVAPLVKASHDKLNEHHADGIKDAGWEAAFEQNRALWQGIAEAAPVEWHPELEKKLASGGYPTHSAIVKDLITRAEAAGEAKGYGKGKEAGIKLGVSEGLARATQLSSLSSDGQQVNGTGGGSGASRWTTKTEARNLHAQDRLSNSEMRRINDDPRIPD